MFHGRISSVISALARARTRPISSPPRATTPHHTHASRTQPHNTLHQHNVPPTHNNNQNKKTPTKLKKGLTIFVYNALAVFSGQPIDNDFYMACYNVVFTALAPLVVGWFDRDLDKAYGLRVPTLYQEGQRNAYLK